MTRKHFIALAEALKDTRPNWRDDADELDIAQRLNWRETVLATASVCSRFNGNFDRGRFFEAAGLTEPLQVTS